jgi:hypothetical protein
MKINIVRSMPGQGITVRDPCFTKETEVLIAEVAEHSVTSRSAWIFFADGVPAGRTHA